MMIVLDICESTPSLNKLRGIHWSRMVRLRARWRWLVKAARLDAKLYTVTPLRKARLTIERWGPKALDTDNFIAGTKQLTDSLVEEGFIVDDTPACIGQPTYLQHIGPRRTIIRIEPA